MQTQTRQAKAIKTGELALLLRLMSPYKALIAGLVVTLMCDITGMLVIPTQLSALLNTAITTRDMAEVACHGIIMLVAALVGSGGNVISYRLAARLAANVGRDLRCEVYRKSLELSGYEFGQLGAGSMITRTLSDANVVQQTIMMSFVMISPVPVTCVIATIMAFGIDPVMGWLLLAVIVLTLGAMAFAVWKSAPVFTVLQGFIDRMNTRLRESITGVRVIRAFTREQTETESFDGRLDGLFAAQRFVGKLSALLNPLTYVVINLAIVAILKTGSVRVDAGVITQGQLIALYNYMSQILVELIKFANLILNITKSVACAGRISQVLETKSSMADGQDALPDGSGSPALQFCGVSFRYPGAGADALSSISFSAAPGQTIGVIGGTGAGKSTLANLIPRFYDATQGQVLVCGEDVRQLRLQALRPSIGVVPQRALLFSGTIRDNLRWGNAQASDEDLWQALQDAQADQVVRGKQGGLDAEVEPGGRNFSGGQRQRLTIARALVRRPAILILDDSASALDFATDAALRKALAHLPWKPTVVLISQRVSSIRHADQILVLDDGRLAGTGTHDELLQSCPVYQEICRSQYKKEDAQ